MGKTTELLKKVEQERANKYTLAVQKESTKETSRTHLPWILVLTFTVILMAILGFNFQTFKMMKSLALYKNVTVTKLNKIEESLTENMHWVEISASDMKQISSKVDSSIKQIGAKVEEIQRQGDAQTVAIENLTKAKNTLFNRVNSLEVEVSKIGATPVK